MVNSDDFIERLHLVMKYFNLSATLFAEKINVQRSSISHILSGRNKPSLDFILKILKGFDEVDLYWLLYGKGTFPKKKKDETNEVFNSLTSVDENIQKLDKQSKHMGSTEIDRIVVFYKDGTFKNYE